MKLSEEMRSPASSWIGGSQKRNTIERWAAKVAKLEAVVEAARGIQGSLYDLNEVDLDILINSLRELNKALEALEE